MGFPAPGSSSGLSLLFASVLAADAAAIDTGAGGIAGGHNVLEIWCTLRTDDAGTAIAVLATLNNDAAAHYWGQLLGGNNATVSAQADSGNAGFNVLAHGSGGTATFAAVTRITIPGYAGTTFAKTGELTMYLPDKTAANQFAQVRPFVYDSTAAITRFAVAANGAQKLKAGSSVYIYAR